MTPRLFTSSMKRAINGKPILPSDNNAQRTEKGDWMCGVCTIRGLYEMNKGGKIEERTGHIVQCLLNASRILFSFWSSSSNSLHSASNQQVSLLTLQICLCN
ncbi:MAG: hypothetical protein ACRD8Z_22405 [Nitrososphaeraceae archaeon]